MLDLMFFSTNQTKLAHFRHICRDLPISIHSFREKTYYAPYIEPRTMDRELLLRESYESALVQFKKASRRPDTGFFFLEDTSVRIDALSKGDDVPGLDVKYWMKGMTFAHLDHLLKSAGNNRFAAVRSDIVLHLPRIIRDALGIKERFLSVHEITLGSIAVADSESESQLLYPWLDNKTFNKWFVPLGCDRPMSQLTIDEADKVDFRRKAFGKVLSYLEHLGVMNKQSTSPPQGCTTPHQIQLPAFPPGAPQFVVCGPTCAGKSTLANILVSKFGYHHIEASDFMYQAFWERHEPGTNVTIGDFAEQALKADPIIVAKRIVKHLTEHRNLPVVITGFRSSFEFSHIDSFMGESKNLKLLFLNADENLRYERSIVRRRPNEGDKNKFNLRNLQEERMGLAQIRQDTRASFLDNNLTIDDMAIAFDLLFQSNLDVLRKYDRFEPVFPRRDLEDTILQSLEPYFKEGKLFTTSQIANLINATRTNEQKKHKDNVSRYFNQIVHPYFDIVIESGKRKYRLSGTGHSKARILCRFR
jgi:inosine/xanthosine triphosphate pyrophosphatase family protein/adenylate kinase family enzyme